MNISAKIKAFLEKLQNLPEHNKKIILWTIVAIFAVILGIFWVNQAINNLEKINKNIGQVKVPQIQSPVKNTETNQTADWKTYANDKYGFLVKYPVDWNFREYDTKDGASFFPTSKSNDNITGNGAVSVLFLKRGTDYCKIPFDDYVKIAGPSEIESYDSVNTINVGTNNNGLYGYQITWNYNDHQGNGKISLPIAYFETKPEFCGDIEVFLNDNNYADIYNKIILNLDITKK